MTLPEKFVGNGVFTAGSDPEMFVFAGPKLLPAFEFLPHKEKAAVGMESVQAYWDGFQAEFRMHSSGYCLDGLCADLQCGLMKILFAARKHNPSAKLSIKNVVRISKETLANADDPFVELGCLPSQNLYGLVGGRVENPRELRYRFAGGHMHFGSENAIAHEQSVKMLDAILGVWSVGAAQSFDSPIRRQYYGLAGEYRTPRYCYNFFGLEYRVLSNFWMCHPALMMITYEIGRLAMKLATTEYADQWLAPKEEVIEAIQTQNVKLAAKILMRNKPVFRWLLSARNWKLHQVLRAFDLGINGLESEIKDPENIAGNWGIEVIRERAADTRSYLENLYGTAGNNFKWNYFTEPRSMLNAVGYK